MGTAPGRGHPQEYHERVAKKKGRQLQATEPQHTKHDGRAPAHGVVLVTNLSWRSG